MDKLQKVRAEIKRQYGMVAGRVGTSGECAICRELLYFIDSTENEPVCKDLEEEIAKEIAKLHTAPCYDELAIFARHFAEWGKNHK